MSDRIGILGRARALIAGLDGWSGALVGGLGIVGLLVAFTGDGTSRSPAQLAESSTVDVELADVLAELRGTWREEERARILAAAPHHAGRFAAPLGRVLADLRHPLLVWATDYAGALGVVELRPAVERLLYTDRQGVRSAAVRAAHRLSPWTELELRGLLADDDELVLVAALEVVAADGKGPWSDVVALLGSDKKAVREAAVRAIPADAPAEVVEQLLAVALRDGTETALPCLRALRRIDLEPSVTETLVAALPRLETELQIEALELLGEGEELADPGAVWRLAQDQSAQPQVRTRAVYCLERTDSFDVAQLVSVSYFLEPRLQYFVARCLIKAGEGAGLELLFDLAREADPPPAGADSAQLNPDGRRDLPIACRQLLARLSGLGPGVAIREFEDRLAETSWQRRARVLPAPTLSF